MLWIWLPHKRLVRLLCLLLVVALMPLQVTASDWPGTEAFQLPEELPAPPFTDVSPHAWYYPYVRVQYALGLMAGTGNDGFSPNGTVPLTQGLTVAVRIYEKYWGIPDASAEYGSPWYAYYVSRAREYGSCRRSLWEHVSSLRALRPGRS
ncbi:MAG: S-layer homology domain-containing protein [Oscillospiraceae bacterium]